MQSLSSGVAAGSSIPVARPVSPGVVSVPPARSESAPVDGRPPIAGSAKRTRRKKIKSTATNSGGGADDGASHFSDSSLTSPSRPVQPDSNDERSMSPAPSCGSTSTTVAHDVDSRSVSPENAYFATSSELRRRFALQMEEGWEPDYYPVQENTGALDDVSEDEGTVLLDDEEELNEDDYEDDVGGYDVATDGERVFVV